MVSELIVGTAAVQRPELITELSNSFGSQCVVVSIQARKSQNSNNWNVMVESGRERSDLDLDSWLYEVQERGAGEIIITSVDKDGTLEGADLDLLEKIYSKVSVPLIFGGGINSYDDINQIIKVNNDISAISIGYALHKDILSIKQIKKIIKENNLPTRNLDSSLNLKSVQSKSRKSLAIVDYSMGNIHSLSNALKRLGYEVEVSSDESVLLNSEILSYQVLVHFLRECDN